jgi:hypothetical protein
MRMRSCGTGVSSTKTRVTAEVGSGSEAVWSAAPKSGDLRMKSGAGDEGLCVEATFSR